MDLSGFIVCLDIHIHSLYSPLVARARCLFTRLPSRSTHTLKTVSQKEKTKTNSQKKIQTKKLKFRLVFTVSVSSVFFQIECDLIEPVKLAVYCATSVLVRARKFQTTASGLLEMFFLPLISYTLENDYDQVMESLSC